MAGAKVFKEAQKITVRIGNKVRVWGLLKGPDGTGPRERIGPK